MILQFKFWALKVGHNCAVKSKAFLSGEKHKEICSSEIGCPWKIIIEKEITEQDLLISFHTQYS